MTVLTPSLLKDVPPDYDNPFVFVYGSLKKGLHNSYLLNKSKLLGRGVTKHCFTMKQISSFPGVLRDGDTNITGELYEVDNIVFDSLDALEGYPTFYDRLVTPIILEDNSTIEAWIYFLETESYINYPTVDNGVWEEQHYG